MSITLLRFSNIAGILCIVAAMTLFTMQDMAIKWLSGDYPLHEIILIRSAVAAIVILAILLPLEGGYNIVHTNKLAVHLLRGFGIVVANLAFYMGLAAMSLAEATSIFFVSPLLITMFSAAFLREHVGVRRWVAVVAGLLGVVIIMRPGSELFRVASILPLIAAIAYALVQVSTRAVGKTEKASTMVIYIQATFIVLCSVSGLAIGDGRYMSGTDPSVDFLFRAWIVPSSGDLFLMGGVGCLMAFGIYLLFQGYRLSEASVIAPFEYIGLPLAVFWGIVVFQDYPDPLAWVGICLIVGAGLYTVYREAIRGRKELFSDPVPKNR
ncbi:MAG: EamA family transporter [Acidiferrobacteraceae bacterium]|nr:EamA family transporter [Acidiferrobacteraceae bacterium]|tara:strand:- start:2208 stop:3179 length:972 start_codon:yes stop_codon:yes gene_type:complete